MLRFILFITVNILLSQTSPQIGLSDKAIDVFSFNNATIHISPDQILLNSNLIIKNNKIVKIGENVHIDGAIEIDCHNKHIYPGFIELYNPIDLDTTLLKSPTKHWNARIHPEYLPSIDNNIIKLNKKLREKGFVLSAISPRNGIFRGSERIVHMGDFSENSIFNGNNIQYMAMESGGWESNDYPGSLLGSIALIRQTFYDARWYTQAWETYNAFPKTNQRPEVDDALNNLSESIKNNIPFCFITNNEQDLERVIKLKNEFNLNLWIIGSGYEYRNLRLLDKSSPFFVLSPKFPPKPDVTTFSRALDVSLNELKHWDQAPFNPYELYNKGVEFAFSSYNLNTSDFKKNIIKSVEHGLDKKIALSALTTIPAKKLGLEAQFGTLEVGKMGYLLITDKNYFDKDSKILSVWIDGKEYIITNTPIIDISGQWMVEDSSYKAIITNENNKFKINLEIDTTKISVKNMEFNYPSLSFSYKTNLDESGVYRYSGYYEEGLFAGETIYPDGSSKKNKLFKILDDIRDKKVDSTNTNSPKKIATYHPEGAYGFLKPPNEYEYIFIENTTIWTSSKKGILKESDLIIKNGKFHKIGKNLRAPKNALKIDGSGKHVTPGLIDAHSHSALSAVNEGTQSITSEVRIKDVINPYDIAIYRELAGGLTSANLLHGSANAIGGQNAVIKLRWGSTAQDMIIEDAIEGIKFALGENVKQSNWGDDYYSRYPQTRMGVDQIIRDGFNAALDYQNKWSEYKKSDKKLTILPRRDLELEALLEIINGERIIHCHSYRQDEILNLIRIADDYEFTIGTFQHVLEGYKVADAIRDHGAGASTFTDWWAYKFEVYDAIPYNGAMMHNQGVLTSFNSDSNELARRMNLEGAKAIKYGDLTPEEALNFVTINPAKQLKIDHRTGSIENNKDADFVIWDSNPLSTYSKCEQTWIDGKKYFDIEEDFILRNRDKELFNTLVQKALKSDEPVKKDAKKKHKHRYLKHSCGIQPYENE